MAHIQGWGGSALSRVVKANHPSLAINDDLALLCLLYGGKEGRDNHLAWHKRCDGLLLGHVLSPYIG